MFKNKREEGAKDREKEEKKEREGFYNKFTEEFGQSVASATVKTDRLSIESYQTLLCLTKTQTMCLRAKCAIQFGKKIWFSDF